jgi:hypothetical protein
MFGLARVADASRGRRLGRRNAAAGAQWREGAGTRERQGGQPAWAREDHGVGLEVGPVSP